MLKVLIAENDLLTADMLEEVLVDSGYDVCGIARSVEEGVALGNLHQPDLALLDLRLAAGGLGTDIAAPAGPQGRRGNPLCDRQCGADQLDAGRRRSMPRQAIPILRRCTRFEDRGRDCRHGKGHGTISQRIPSA